MSKSTGGDIELGVMNSDEPLHYAREHDVHPSATPPAHPSRIETVSDIVAFIATLIILAIFQWGIKPTAWSVSQGYDVSTIAFPHHSDTVNMLVVWGAALLFTFLCLLECFWRLRWNMEELAAVLRAFIMSILITTLVTTVVKVVVGRPRPDFLARCYGNDRALNGPMLTWSDLSAAMKGNCTDTYSKRVITEGRLSFPSGHSSISFAMATTFSLYIVVLSRVFRGPGRFIYKLLLAFIPLILATLVAVSRVTDNKHHPTDVLAGSILGLWFGFITFVYQFWAKLVAMIRAKFHPLDTMHP